MAGFLIAQEAAKERELEIFVADKQKSFISFKPLALPPLSVSFYSPLYSLLFPLPILGAD